MTTTKTRTITAEDKQLFTLGYVDCMVWLATVNDPNTGELVSLEDVAPLGVGAVTEALVNRLSRDEEVIIAIDCFLAEAGNYLVDSRDDGIDWGRLGHDFQLTGNGYGEGFESPGYDADVSEKLTDLAQHWSLEADFWVNLDDEGVLQSVSYELRKVGTENG